MTVSILLVTFESAIISKPEAILSRERQSEFCTIEFSVCTTSLMILYLGFSRLAFARKSGIVLSYCHLRSAPTTLLELSTDTLVKRFQQYLLRFRHCGICFRGVNSSVSLPKPQPPAVTNGRILLLQNLISTLHPSTSQAKATRNQEEPLLKQQGKARQQRQPSLTKAFSFNFSSSKT